MIAEICIFNFNIKVSKLLQYIGPIFCPFNSKYLDILISINKFSYPFLYLFSLSTRVQEEGRKEGREISRDLLVLSYLLV